MKSDALIEALAADTRPVRRGAVERRLFAGICAGVLATLLLLAGLLGIRPDLQEAASGEAFWGRTLYSLALGLVGFKFAVQLARPDCGRLPWCWLGAPLAFAVAWEASIGPSVAPERLDRVLALCASVSLILTLAVPPFAGLVLALRAFAPTRLVATGAAAGLAAGGSAAAIYGLHSPHISPAHGVTCCTAVIGLAAVLGAIAGPRLLRW